MYRAILKLEFMTPVFTQLGLNNLSPQHMDLHKF
jgi:hypothetical protein